MTDDVEPFMLCWRLKIRVDNLEVCLRGPESTSTQPLASVPELTLAQAVWYVYKVQFMRNVCALDQLAKPHTLFLCSGCEIERDGDPF
jgi:hypothetical protein